MTRTALKDAMIAFDGLPKVGAAAMLAGADQRPVRAAHGVAGRGAEQ